MMKRWFSRMSSGTPLGSRSWSGSRLAALGSSGPFGPRYLAVPGRSAGAAHSLRCNRRPRRCYPWTRKRILQSSLPETIRGGSGIQTVHIEKFSLPETIMVVTWNTDVVHRGIQTVLSGPYFHVTRFLGWRVTKIQTSPEGGFTHREKGVIYSIPISHTRYQVPARQRHRRRSRTWRRNLVSVVSHVS